MNTRFTATVTAKAAALHCLAIALLLAPIAIADPIAPAAVAEPPAPAAVAEPPAPAAPSPASIPSPAPIPSPAVGVVEQYLAAHMAEQIDRAYALLSANSQAWLPVARRELVANEMTSPNRLRTMQPATLLLVALFSDIHNVLHLRFRVLGPSPDNPAVVLVSASQDGTPPSTIKTLQVATAADPGAGGALRVDAEETEYLAMPQMRQMTQDARGAPSQSNLKKLSLAIIMYAQDNDQKLPDADKWVDEIMPYVKNEAVFCDPAAPDLKYGYAFNRALSGARLGGIKDPLATVMVFESMTGVKNAADTGQSLPRPGRHSGGDYFVFADGRAGWVADGAKLSYALHGT